MTDRKSHQDRTASRSSGKDRQQKPTGDHTQHKGLSSDQAQRGAARQNTGMDTKKGPNNI